MIPPEPLESFLKQQEAPGFQVYYDSSRNSFWVQNDRAGWITIKTPEAKLWLIEKGLSKKLLNGSELSPVEAQLISTQRSNDVDYADSLAGYSTGVYMINEKRILVRDSPKLIEPGTGEWPLLQGIILRMLGDLQQQYLFGWLKVAIEALRNSKNRVGQALVIAGPRDCGKSLLQNLITLLLGGRSHKPHRYMSGLTAFNSELFGAEHLMIEDEEASTDIRARRNFGTKIKEITANTTQSCHGKNRIAIHLTPFWRLSTSVNDEPENLMILPPMDESLEDKFIILKAEKHPMPLPTGSLEQRDKFMNALRAELPHFIHFLLNWTIPEELVSDRYGITHFQHSDILQALGTLAPEVRLLEIIDAVLFTSAAPAPWEGSATDLERTLTGDTSKLRREAEKLFHFSTACGTYLGRLKKLQPLRFKSIRSSTQNRWKIEPPEDE